MSKEALVIHSEYVKPNITIEICRRYINTEQTSFDIVFLVNYKGVEFTVFEHLIDAARSAGLINDAVILKPLLYTSDEAYLLRFLEGKSAIPKNIYVFAIAFMQSFGYSDLDTIHAAIAAYERGAEGDANNRNIVDAWVLAQSLKGVLK